MFFLHPHCGLPVSRKRQQTHLRKLARGLASGPLATFMMLTLSLRHLSSPVFLASAPAKLAASGHAPASPSILSHTAAPGKHIEASAGPSYQPWSGWGSSRANWLQRALACVCCRALLAGNTVAGASVEADRRLCQTKLSKSANWHARNSLQHRLQV